MRLCGHRGFGGPLGFGMLDDLEGDDHYYCGGMWRTSYYPETPGYEGWGQGVGAGLRGVTSGGIGVILDGNGDDVYEYDYFGQGGGYWLGVGFARDFGGNDRRLGGTQKAYDGSPRTQPMFDRFSCGFGCHYALGFCFDDNGNDTYGGTIMGLGFSWDCSNGFLCDFAGNDRYEATGGLTEGDGAQAGLGVLLDYCGNDTYQGYNQGYASPGISYHSLPRCGGNFSFLIDYGGNDAYGCGIQNNSYSRRGCEGGFLIDRPLQEEVEAKKAADTKKSGNSNNKIVKKTMNIAITSEGNSLESSVDPRFGRAMNFLLIDTDTGEFSAHDNAQNLSAVQGAGIQAAQTVARLGAEAVLTGHVGPKAFATLQAANIAIYTGVSGTAKEAIEQFKNGQLELAVKADVQGHWG